MDGSQVLGVGLATLASALKSRRLALMEELRQVERDLEAVDQCLAAGERMGFREADAPSPATSTTTSAPAKPRPAVDDLDMQYVSSPRPRKAAPPRGEDYELRQAALASIGKVRNDRAIPSKVEDGKYLDNLLMSRDPTELAAVRESMGAIAEKVLATPPGPGGRRFEPTGRLVPGEPIAPVVRRILEVADRPLSTLEVTIAFLRVRKVELDPREMSSLVNRMSSLLGKHAHGTDGFVRVQQVGSRLIRWRLAKRPVRQST